MVELLIRAYRVEDWPTVCRIYDRSKPDELRGPIDPAAISPLANDARMKTLFAQSHIHVAEWAAHVAGFAGARGNFITWMFVDPEHRRRGIAQRLLDHMLNRLQGPVTLNVAKLNQPALHLYARAGFVVEREFEGQFTGRSLQVLKLRYDAAA